jgi:hypothetical protein
LDHVLEPVLELHSERPIWDRGEALATLGKAIDEMAFVTSSQKIPNIAYAKHHSILHGCKPPPR